MSTTKDNLKEVSDELCLIALSLNQMIQAEIDVQQLDRIARTIQTITYHIKDAAYQEAHLRNGHTVT